MPFRRRKEKKRKEAGRGTKSLFSFLKTSDGRTDVASSTASSEATRSQKGSSPFSRTEKKSILSQGRKEGNLFGRRDEGQEAIYEGKNKRGWGVGELFLIRRCRSRETPRASAIFFSLLSPCFLKQEEASLTFLRQFRLNLKEDLRSYKRLDANPPRPSSVPFPFSCFMFFVQEKCSSRYHSWARTPRILRLGKVYYIKFVCYYNGIQRLGVVYNPDPLRAQVW